MNKLFNTVLLILVLVTLGASQSISITSPTARDNFSPGDICEIKWRKSGRTGASVKIRLFDSTKRSKILSITDSTGNNGSFRWKIPASVPNGTYFLRVRTVNNKVTGDSNPFKIKSGTPPVAAKNINVILPRAGEVFRRGSDTIKVRFNSSGLDGNATIELICTKCTPPQNKIIRSSFYIKKSGFDFSVPSNFITGKYFLKISSSDGTVGKSGIFKIVFNKNEKILDIFSNPVPGTATIKDPINNGMVVINNIPRISGTVGTPKIELLDLLNQWEFYGYQTHLKFKFRNAESVILIDPEGNKIYSWQGDTSKIISDAKPVIFRKLKNVYTLITENKNGSIKGTTIGYMKPEIEKFKLRNIKGSDPRKYWNSKKGEKLVFEYSFSGGKYAYMYRYLDRTKNKTLSPKFFAPALHKVGTFTFIHEDNFEDYYLVVVGNKTITSKFITVL